MDLRYPIGEFKYEAPLTDAKRQACLAIIEETPARMRAAVAGLNEEQLDTAYRPEGWTVRQVVHHVPESHLNSYIRFKLALTEDEPTIKPYYEDRWAQLEDASEAPIALSLDLLDALHGRWIWFLRSLKPEDFQRTFRHPDLGIVSLDKNVALYAWHGPHHVAQITSLRERMGW
ncbi:MAG TPA: putative metal-dependent hydrolase [Pyrinomonadaceae bacterium]|nr:putative metal-dependent hydrolase [Pyrinomonadaceae bacterium]